MRILFLALVVAVLLAVASAKKSSKKPHHTTSKHPTNNKYHPATITGPPSGDSAPTGTCTSPFSTHPLAPTPTPHKNKCKSFTDNFTSQKDIVLQENYHGVPSPTGPNWIDLSGTNGRGAVVTKDGLELILFPPKKGQHTAYATTLTSAYAMQYGTAIVEMKMNETPGFVNAFIMMSPNSDEIDWEFVGNEPTAGQTNFYFQGYKFYGVNGERNQVPGGLVNATFHKYGFHWDPEKIQWSIDGRVVRTALKANTWNACDKKYHFPYQAGYVQLGVWDGSIASSWSHGPIPWKSIKNPLKAYVKSVTVQCDPTWNIIV